MQIRASTNQRVRTVLNRNTPDWRLKHACPACTYKIEDEAPLVFKMLYTVDGNDSLRRVLRRSTSEDDEGHSGPTSELPSSLKVDGDRYLTRDYVDQWANGVLQEMLGDEPNIVSA